MLFAVVGWCSRFPFVESHEGCLLSESPQPSMTTRTRRRRRQKKLAQNGFGRFVFLALLFEGVGVFV